MSDSSSTPSVYGFTPDQVATTKANIKRLEEILEDQQVLLKLGIASPAQIEDTKRTIEQSRLLLGLMTKRLGTG